MNVSKRRMPAFVGGYVTVAQYNKLRALATLRDEKVSETLRTLIDEATANAAGVRISEMQNRAQVLADDGAILNQSSFSDARQGNDFSRCNGESLHNDGHSSERLYQYANT